MRTVELIGVPFDGYGRPGNQAAAPAALRAAGLTGAFRARDVVLDGDIVLPAQTDNRAESGLMNEPALIALVEGLHARVVEAYARQHFPVVYGADCSVLLGVIPALRDVAGNAGLVFVDGHEDGTMISASPDGEVANMEIALLLGLTNGRLPQALNRRLPALELPGLAMLGQRDREWIRSLGTPTLLDRGVRITTSDAIALDPASCARDAVQHVASHARRWWLHVDLDVLSGEEFSARGEGGEDQPLPGGLKWPDLTTLVAEAFRAGGCAGWSIVIYNPDRDKDGAAGKRIVQFVGDVASAMP